jgi:hypothetical protein
MPRPNSRRRKRGRRHHDQETTKLKKLLRQAEEQLFRAEQSALDLRREIEAARASLAARRRENAALTRLLHNLRRSIFSAPPEERTTDSVIPRNSSNC